MAQIFDDELVAFLQWALPRLGYRWRGYRKVRRQVKKRISRRIDELELQDLEGYRAYLEQTPGEWEELDSFCRITISRFYRDRATWHGIRRIVLPELADMARSEGRQVLRALSIGAASGEEPYTLRLCWVLDERRPWTGLGLEIDAIDADAHMVERARRARYPEATLRELPEGWRKEAFEKGEGELFELRPDFRRSLEYQVADIREYEPDGTYDICLCRNMAFMYFDAPGRRKTLRKLGEALYPGAALVVGNHDVVPEMPELFSPWPEIPNMWRRSFGDTA